MAIDRLEATSRELAMLRLLHLVFSGAVALAAGERDEVERLGLVAGRAEGLEAGATTNDVRAGVWPGSSAGERARRTR